MHKTLKAGLALVIAAIALPHSGLMASQPTRAPMMIHADLSDKTLTVGNKTYSIAVGAPETPSPIGIFEIQDIWEFRRAAVFASSTIPGLGYGKYAIHTGWHNGSTQGCLVTSEPDLNEILSALQVGDKIKITP